LARDKIEKKGVVVFCRGRGGEKNVLLIFLVVFLWRGNRYKNRLKTAL